MTVGPSSAAALLREIADIGVDAIRGGYSRPVYSPAEVHLREWFVAAAADRGLDVQTDRNGIIWAWWDVPSGDRSGALVTGSHFDSVPGGGAFDGPLGVASALAAVDILRTERRQPVAPIAIAVFPEEEGSRFGMACLGSQLMAGRIDPDRARALRDDDGFSFAERSAANGIDPNLIGPDPQALNRIGAFVELHVEQGRGLIDLDRPVAIGRSILSHGRWRLSVTGQGNHAGTTHMADRRDPMITAAQIVLAVQQLAAGTPDARATVGRIVPVPGGTNVIASRVDLWLDARHPDDTVTADLVSAIADRARALAESNGCTAGLVEESMSPTVRFDAALTARLSAILPDAPLLGTGAGHDAGVLATRVPTGMLFVRNPSGISHSPEEHVDDADADAGARALADVLTSLFGVRGNDSEPLGATLPADSPGGIRRT